MSLWKNTDNTANSTLFAVAGFNKAPTATNRDALFGNTTPDAYTTGEIVGQFGVDATEAGVANGTVHSVVFITAGSGYNANATVTTTGGAGFSTAVSANGFANSMGRIEQIKFPNNGVNYTFAPALTVAAPTALFFPGNTLNVSSASDTIDLGTANAALFSNGDKVVYTVASGNTTITGLTSGSTYYITGKTGTTIKLAATPTGSAIDISTAVTTAQAGHSLTGETASVVPVISTGKMVAHAGWVTRTVGTGGRAGRVQCETLVAMGSMSGDAENVIFKQS